MTILRIIKFTGKMAYIGGSIMNRRIVLAVAIMCIMAIHACTDEIEPLGPYIQTFLVKDSVEYAFEVNGNVFESGDTVWMFFLVTNMSSKTVKFGPHNCAVYCGFNVRLGHVDIWESCRYPPPCGVSSDSLLPRETFLYQCWWPTISDNRTFFEQDDDYPVAPGEYTIYARPGVARPEGVLLSLTVHVVDYDGITRNYPLYGASLCLPG